MVKEIKCVHLAAKERRCIVHSWNAVAPSRLVSPHKPSNSPSLETIREEEYEDD